MQLSLYQNKILLHLEKNENFIKIQDSTFYNLCYENIKGDYMIPYVAMPILMNIAKKIGYPISLSPTLKKYYQDKTSKRQFLEKIKAMRALEDEIPEDIRNSILGIQKKYNYSLMPGQDVSVAYGMIGKRVIIANDIGTGKTITVNTIAKCLLEMGRIKKVLVMLPAALVNNYHDDYVKFFGQQGILSITKRDTKSKREDKYHSFVVSPLIQFIVINYDKCNFDYELLKKLNPDMLIVDEFHNMKNFLFAKRSQNFFELVINNWKPEYRIPMSGTPIENQLFDLYPIFKLIDGGHILGGQKFFQENFIEWQEESIRIFDRRSHRYILKTEIKPKGFKNDEYLHKLIKPLVIRKKLKLKVGKYPTDIIIEPSNEMLKHYDLVKLQHKGNPSAGYHAARQFLCDTSRGDFHSNPKLEQFEEIISQTDEKFVIFSFYKCTVHMLEKYLSEKGMSCLKITGEEKEDPLETIQRFKTSPARFLLCTDKVNFGHNIQFCRYMIQWEKPHKPTTEEQRIGRLYRTGQENDVHIYSFVVSNTVEEKIHEQFQKKQLVIKTVVETLNDKELKKIEEEMEKEVMREFT